MAKKVAISITLDGDVLKELDSALREVQEKELKDRKPLSNRSGFIEKLIRSSLGRSDSRE
ncbi:MAG TPA: hypothetical protein VFE91_07910 [Nitrososphaerales archaeon]|nr:hypothetical protein [Nitrososphaerales archaeon]